MHDYETLLEEFTQTQGTAVALRQARAFMIDYLRLLQRPMPDVVGNALSVAEQFSRAEVPEHAVIDANRACWAFIEQRFANSDFTDPTHNVVQAAICLLAVERPASERPADFLPWFLSLADSFEDHARDREALLKKHFAA